MWQSWNIVPRVLPFPGLNPSPILTWVAQAICALPGWPCRTLSCPLTSAAHPRESDGLDLEMQGDETEHQRLQVLDQIVKDPQAFRVRRLGHVVDRANLGSLGRVSDRPDDTHQETARAGFTSNEMWSFPTRISSSCLPSLFLVGHFASSSLDASISLVPQGAREQLAVLQNLAFLDNPLDLVNDQRADKHCHHPRVLVDRRVRVSELSGSRTLFPNEAVVSVVGVVGIAGGSAAAVTDHAEIELWTTECGQLKS